VSAIVRFSNGVQGNLESCRIVNGAKCDMSFEVYGTKGALKWNMEKMNELHFQRCNTSNLAEDGYTEWLSGPVHPYHKHFNPAWGLAIGYDDTKVIEAHNFLKSIASDNQGQPGFRQAYHVAKVQQAIIRSWDSERWEPVTYEE